jgi:hypothetical protein
MLMLTSIVAVASAIRFAIGNRGGGSGSAARRAGDVVSRVSSIQPAFLHCARGARAVIALVATKAAFSAPARA